MKAVVFDVNHTLIAMHNEAETQAAAVRLMRQVAQARSGIDVEREAFAEAYAISWERAVRDSYNTLREIRYESVVESTLESFGVRFTPRELEELLQEYMQPLYSASYVVPGMTDLLGDLERRVSVGIVTNYKYASGMREMLRRLDLLRFLSAVVISSEVGWKKPSERIYEVALAKLGVGPQDCVVVGNDFEKDLWPARQLGMSTILFSAIGAHPANAHVMDELRKQIPAAQLRPDAEAHSVDELRTALEELGRRNQRNLIDARGSSAPTEE